MNLLNRAILLNVVSFVMFGFKILLGYTSLLKLTLTRLFHKLFFQEDNLFKLKVIATNISYNATSYKSSSYYSFGN